MGMKVCLRGIAVEFHLYVDMSIYFEAINEVKLTLKDIVKRELQEVKKQLEAYKLAT